MQKRIKPQMRKIVTFLLIVAMAFSTGNPYGLLSVKPEANEVQAAETTKITSMDYYDSNNGPTQSKSGVTDASFGFVMPKFNGKKSQELALPEVEKDLQLYVKQDEGTNGEWKKIDDVSYFLYNSTWGWEHQQWTDDADGWVCWFKLNETTEIRFHGITNNINLDYKFTFTKLPVLKLTSISSGPEANITADATGGSATHWGEWTFNGDKNVIYDQVKDDIDILVNNNDGKGWVQFLANADSGFIWDQNFGIYTDGTGGYWFLNIDWSFTLRFQKKGNPAVYTDVKVTYKEPVRNNWTLSSFNGTTTLDAKNESHTASLAIQLPKIGGTEAVRKDLDLFTYEVCIGATYSNGKWTGGQWVALNDVGSSGWIYQGNGYSKYSDNQQWGYWVDHVYGLWFRPVKKDTYIRIGYPQNGQSGGAINNNYVYYTFLGDPEAKIPDVSDMGDITVDDNNDSDIETPDGWSLIWNDEFNGTTLDNSKWTRQTGYLLDENDINTFGWGNKELEHYTDSEENSSVQNGSLKITLKKDKKTFAQKDDPSKTKTALYSSGKLISRNKFSVKYGRVDFRAKLPTGTGVWPAMWMMPNDDRYGTWASSGEIDVFEGRGRIPNMVFGTIHFGSQWPGNVNASDMFNMVENGNKKTDFSDWHVYSLVWEEDSIKIYCDGKCYFKCTNAEWYSGADRGNPNAPFDQRFYLIMNLAAGGVFDNGYEPNYDTFTEANMYVDYVRVFQRQVGENQDEKPDTIEGVKTNGANDNLYGDYKLGDGSTPIVDPETPRETERPSGSDELTTPSDSVDTTTPSGSGDVTTPSDSGNKTTVKPAETKVKVPGKVKIKKIKAKKKTAKKVKISLKKISGVSGYQIALYKNKKKAKKNKKAIVKKFVKKAKVTIKSKKLKNKKKLYARARAYNLDGKTKVYGKWSKVKKVKIKK
ncbi:MAG: glycoside hydrolase family 16 protein [Eubacterium sp.]